MLRCRWGKRFFVHICLNDVVLYNVMQIWLNTHWCYNNIFYGRCQIFFLQQVWARCFFLLVRGRSILRRFGRRRGWLVERFVLGLSLYSACVPRLQLPISLCNAYVLCLRLYLCNAFRPDFRDVRPESAGQIA